MTARTSLRLLAVLNVLFKYACARQTTLSRTSPRRVVRNTGYRPPSEKKTEGLYKSRDSCLVFRDS